jgi:two-component system sensor histidine kinase MprB
MKVRTRVTLAAAGLATALGAVLVGSAYLLEARDLRRQVEVDLERRASVVVSELQAPGGPDSVAHPPFGSQAAYAQVLSADGSVSPLSRGVPDLPVEEGALAVARGEEDRHLGSPTLDGVHLRVLTVPLEDGTALQVARPVDEIDLHLVHTLGILVGLLAVAALVAVGAGRMVARSALRPVEELADTAREIAASRDLSRRLETAGDAELASLADSLNTLVEALDGAVTTQQRLVADASHELQTPLTVLRADIGLLARLSEMDPGERRRLLGELDDEVARISRLVANLVDLARDRLDPDARVRVDLDALVEEVVDAVRSAHPGVRIECRLEPVEVVVDPDQVIRLVRNLVDNAASWTPVGGVVLVRLRAGQIEVSDEGPGVPSEHLARIFERFYRVPGAQPRAGSGLGLAIARKAALEHGWEVRAANGPRGAVFTVDMPSPGASGATGGATTPRRPRHGMLASSR